MGGLDLSKTLKEDSFSFSEEGLLLKNRVFGKEIPLPLFIEAFHPHYLEEKEESFTSCPFPIKDVLGPESEVILDLSRTLHDFGLTFFCGGGYVRDSWFRRPWKDIDIFIDRDTNKEQLLPILSQKYRIEEVSSSNLRGSLEGFEGHSPPSKREFSNFKLRVEGVLFDFIIGDRREGLVDFHTDFCKFGMTQSSVFVPPQYLNRDEIPSSATVYLDQAISGSPKDMWKQLMDSPLEDIYKTLRGAQRKTFEWTQRISRKYPEISWKYDLKCTEMKKLFEN